MLRIVAANEQGGSLLTNREGLPMTHFNLTRWIEDADAREVLLEGVMVRSFQEETPGQFLHLGPTIKAVVSWWHHSLTEHPLAHTQGPASTRHH